MSRGTTVHIPIHYDARTNPQSPSYDPAHADHRRPQGPALAKQALYARLPNVGGCTCPDRVTRSTRQLSGKCGAVNTNQGDDTMNETQWRRPAACNTDQATGNCYEVATAGGAVGVRSSQHPDDIAIDTRAAFATFVQACKNGEYDDLT